MLFLSYAVPPVTFNFRWGGTIYSLVFVPIEKCLEGESALNVYIKC
jgi:hypothetical protein